jgi:hypothetical protein
MWRKRHIAQQTAAMRRAISPKRHVFRPDFEQSDGQLTLTHASGVKHSISDILF